MCCSCFDDDSCARREPSGCIKPSILISLTRVHAHSVCSRVNGARHWAGTHECAQLVYWLAETIHTGLILMHADPHSGRSMPLSASVPIVNRTVCGYQTLTEPRFDTETPQVNSTSASRAHREHSGRRGHSLLQVVLSAPAV